MQHMQHGTYTFSQTHATHISMQLMQHGTYTFSYTHATHTQHRMASAYMPTCPIRVRISPYVLLCRVAGKQGSTDLRGDVAPERAAATGPDV